MQQINVYKNIETIHNCFATGSLKIGHRNITNNNLLGSSKTNVCNRNNDAPFLDKLEQLS